MSYILATVMPQDILNWIKANDASSLKGTAGDSWRAYLSSHGGTGKTTYDLEVSYLNSQSVSTVGTLRDRWSTKLSGTVGKTTHEQARNFYK